MIRVRALQAALEIHEFVKGLSPMYEGRIGVPLSMHSGINTGLVVTAEVDPEKGSQGVAGDAVNLAARLSGLAGPGEILAGEETVRRTRGRFDFQDLGAKRVKGKAEPVAVFKLISGRGQTPSLDRQVSSAMVGRDRELDRLELQVMKVVNGEGSVVNIIGEAGIGKSRLMAELRRREVMQKGHFAGRPGHLHRPEPELPSPHRSVETVGRDLRGGLRRLPPSTSWIGPYGPSTRKRPRRFCPSWPHSWG